MGLELLDYNGRQLKTDLIPMDVIMIKDGKLTDLGD